jgi:hypothetical protein
MTYEPGVWRTEQQRRSRHRRVRSVLDSGRRPPSTRDNDMRNGAESCSAQRVRSFKRPPAKHDGGFLIRSAAGCRVSGPTEVSKAAKPGQRAQRQRRRRGPGWLDLDAERGSGLLRQEVEDPRRGGLPVGRVAANLDSVVPQA